VGDISQPVISRWPDRRIPAFTAPPGMHGLHSFVVIVLNLIISPDL
jgi:hypothetical protein